MTTLHIEIDEATLTRIRREAERHGQTIEQYAAERIAPEETPTAEANERAGGAEDDLPQVLKDCPIFGMSADEPELEDEILDQIMKDRERPWRLP